MLEIVKIILPIGIMILRSVDVVNSIMVDVEEMKIVLPQIQSVKNVVVIEMKHQHQDHKLEVHHHLKELLKLQQESHNQLLQIKMKFV